MNEVTLSSAGIEHIDGILAIEDLSFKTPWTKDAFVYEFTRNKCARYIVALRGEMVVAYGGMWIMIDEAHVTNIAVHPEFRGIGIGNSLMEEMIKLAKSEGASSMTLEVRRNNSAALNLYKKYGFIEAAIRKGYYQDTKEDAIVMWKYDI